MQRMIVNSTFHPMDPYFPASFRWISRVWFQTRGGTWNGNYQRVLYTPKYPPPDTGMDGSRPPHPPTHSNLENFQTWVFSPSSIYPATPKPPIRQQKFLWSVTQFSLEAQTNFWGLAAYHRRDDPPTWIFSRLIYRLWRRERSILLGVTREFIGGPQLGTEVSI